MDGIKCMCEECTFNDNKRCKAKSIEVRSSGDKKVLTSDGTCCDTFKSQSDNSNLNG